MEWRGQIPRYRHRSILRDMAICEEYHFGNCLVHAHDDQDANINLIVVISTVKIRK